MDIEMQQYEAILQTLSPMRVRKVAILGAGVMGAQIAAHFVNAGYEALLYDLPSGKGSKNHLAEQAIAALPKLSPAPLASKTFAQFIYPKNYEDNLQELSDCQLIIEAIAEREDWKHDLYNKIALHVSDEAILCTNTSGLSINALAKNLNKKLKNRFCGLHFFNPPRYMPLVELIPSDTTDPALIDKLETFLVTRLGKEVVRAKDTPNFIGNRIGVFALLSALKYAEQFDLRLDVVDALTGTLIGHPKSATLRTLDVVGLDTFSHVVNTMHHGLKDDPYHDLFTLPDWLKTLVDRGYLGQKTGQGVYKKDNGKIFVYDLKDDSYRETTGQPHKDVIEILKTKNPADKFAKLKASQKPEAQFLWHYYQDVWTYCATHLNDIAHSPRDVDRAMQFGFGWKQGPFEEWQASGIKLDCELPTASESDKPGLPVYLRQMDRDAGETLYEDEFVRLFQQSDPIAILSFKSKQASISNGVLEGIRQALPIAVDQCLGMVIWQQKWKNFSVGADISEFLSAINAKDFDSIEDTLYRFQQMCLSIRHAPIPVVAALQGYVFGGGCELALHCDRRVASLETYMGLVEAGVGLLPAGGGCKTFVERANGKDMMKAFETIAMAKASSSAYEARELRFLDNADPIIMNPQELLCVAKQQALAMAMSDYTPPRPTRTTVQGESAWAQFETVLVNQLEGGFISRHDYLIAHHIGKVLAGGIVTPMSQVDTAWLLKLERDGFIELAKTPETKARIEHMLATGKPLRN